MILLMLVAFLFARVARRHLFVVRSLVLLAKPLIADAIDLDAMHFVVASTAAVIGGSGWMYAAGKPYRLGEK